MSTPLLVLNRFHRVRSGRIGTCCLIAAALSIGGFPTADGQQPPAAASPTDQQPPADEQVEAWIEALGAADFAAREQAASDLMAVGDAVITRLSKVAETHSDPEVRIRASEIVKQLNRDDLKLRIDAFLAGEAVDLQGWSWMQAIMGDSISVRELFVEMLEAHPDLLASLEGTPRDRAVALEKVVSAVEFKMFVEQEFPDRADAISLLLPTVDPRVPLEGGFEDVLIAVLHKSAVSGLHRDNRLSAPFQSLLGRWLARSSLRNREDLLTYGLMWELPQTHELAMRTLKETQSSDALVLAFQAIAQYGDPDDAESLSGFLDDSRPAAELGFGGGEQWQTQIGDVAMAAIARLHDVPLTEIGFAKESLDDRFAFTPEDLGFPADDPDARQQAKTKVQKLLEQKEGL